MASVLKEKIRKIMTNKSQTEEILTTWEINAEPWINAIANNEIQSRIQITNKAIVDTIVQLNPNLVWDAGCGEGWLGKELLKQNIKNFGTDAIATLINKAKTIHENYFVANYEQILSGEFKPTLLADLVAINFALFNNEETEELIKYYYNYLPINGKLVIQTLHPIAACGNEPYQNGWRKGSWTGFNTAFSRPAPWYFRTLSQWVTTINQAGFVLNALNEPADHNATLPSSLIIIAEKVQ
jgi:2-polyprenyl-3-methyl-5-hydroxy-6-metoxy-1,4-benzoquinol methylase